MSGKLKAITRWCISIMALILACVLTVAFCSAEGETGENIIRQMQEAAQVQLVTNKFIRCLEIESGNGKMWFGDGNAILKGDIFANGGASQTDVLSGAWLEKQVQGKVDNGTIWCSNNESNIVNVFTRTLEITREQLFCDGDRPGIMSLQVFREGTDGKVDHWETIDSACSIGIGNGDYKFVPTADRLGYVKQLYEQYKEKSGNPYLVDWDSVSYFGDAKLAYFLYLNDFITACAGLDNYYKGDPNLMSANRYFSTPLRVVSLSTGKVEERYYSKQSIVKDNWKDSFVVDGPHTCENVIDRINGSGDYSDRQELSSAISETIANFRKAANIADCFDKYKTELAKFEERVRDYSLMQNLAKYVKNRLSDISEQIQAGKLEATGEDEFGNPLHLDDLVKYANGTSSESFKVLRQGIADKNIYNDTLLETIQTAFKDIANNTQVNADHVTIDSKPTEETFTKFDELLNQWQEEIDRVGGEVETAEAKLDEKRNAIIEDKVPADIYSFDENKIYDEQAGVACIGLENLAKEIDGIFSAAPPEINTDWSGVTLPDNSGEFDNSGGGGEGANAISCFTEGSSLGWILCPTIEIIGSAASGLYDWVVTSWISVGDSEMQADNSNGVYVGWKSFRDMANIIFVIMLIIVIFSQVTGLGLTNYGIKKTLPTLIMVAVLVNLSFIICQLAVDVTNILGDGTLQLFRSLPVTNRVSVSGLVTGISTLITLGAAGGVAAGAITIYGVSGLFSALLIPALIGLITILISVLFFFIVLAVRKVGIYILIVLSPVAIILYTLPNTKNLFQKWMKLFTSLLMVYPICGILMGGGEFFSNILLGSSASANFFVALVAALLQVVPFFMIPSLVRSSLALAGNIGNRIGQLSSRLNRMAGGTINRSRWAQDRQRELAHDVDMRRSRRLQDRNQRAIDRLNKRRTNPDADGDLSGLSKTQRRRYQRLQTRYARAASTYNRLFNEDVEARNIAENFNEEMLQNQEAASKRRYHDSMVSNFTDGTLSSNTYHRSDGSIDTVDVNDPDSIKAALANLAQDVRNNPNDKLAMTRMESMLEVAKRKGGKGRQAIIDVLHANNTPDGLATARQMAKRLSLDDKFMGALHANDAGSEAFIQDLATDQSIKSRSAYAQKTIESMKLDNVGDLEDSFFDNLNELYTEMSDLRSSGSDPAKLKKLEESYQKATSTLVQAASDPRYAGRIKAKDAQNIINTHAKQAYEIERAKWLNNTTNLSQLSVTDASGATAQATGVDSQGYLVNGTSRLLDASGNAVKAQDAYSSQIKAYHDVALGQGNPAELKVLRKRAMPAGVKIDPATNRYRMEVPPTNGAAGPPGFRDLTPDEQRVVDKIMDYNASVDIQNQENQ